jgi:Lysophospholipase L1 and related esterases
MIPKDRIIAAPYMSHRSDILSPGNFSLQVAADSRRLEFDYKNEVIISNDIPVDFVFIGDSITHFWELNAYFRRQGKLVLNRGIGGDTTEYVLKRFEADVVQLKPWYAVMKIGVNDTLKLESDPWQKIVGSYPEAVEEGIARNIKAIIELAGNRKQDLILCSILPTNMVVTQKNKERNILINRVNSKLEMIAKESGIIYVDYYSHFIGSDRVTLMDGVSDDGVHPHVVGYNMMADILRETLMQNSIEI